MPDSHAFDAYSPQDIVGRVRDFCAVKARLPLLSLTMLGILAGAFIGLGALMLMCMAVWMALAGRSVTDKAVAIVFPITAFVAAGFEHSIANMYIMPLAMLLGAPLGAADMLRNLVPVIAGNLVGGSVLVALVYYVIYIRSVREDTAARATTGAAQDSTSVAPPQ